MAPVLMAEHLKAYPEHESSRLTAALADYGNDVVTASNAEPVTERAGAYYHRCRPFTLWRYCVNGGKQNGACTGRGFWNPA